MPMYLDSDRDSTFISAEVKTLYGYEISTSRNTSYKPQDNEHCESYNGILWRAITLALKAQRLPITQWENVLHALQPIHTTFNSYGYSFILADPRVAVLFQNGDPHQEKFF